MITFVKTRYQYDSYMDFWTLVSLAGFPTVYVDELDVSQPGVYIVSPMNGEWRPHVDNQADRRRNAHLVLWNLERPSGSAGAVGKYAEQNWDLMHRRHVDEVWVSDRRLAQEAELRFVVLGSHESLGEPGERKRYDLCHMSYETPRRQTIYKRFNEDKIGPNCWPPERDEVLRLSKFALNVHQDQHPFQEPLRFALFAAYGLPIVTETIYDSFPWSDEFMVYSDYYNLVGTMLRILGADYEEWREMGRRARERMCGQAVEESVGDWR
jgi:hypothetical protein